jgi:transcriptional regulator with XRE-family HTH domain
MWSEVLKMIKEQQEKFYAMVGKYLTTARKRRNMSVQELAKKSGEQNKTVRWIEDGNTCSLHHILWMSRILKIDINNIIEDIEGKYEQETIDGLDSII